MKTKVVYDENNYNYIILVKRFFFSPWEVLCAKYNNNRPVRYYKYEYAYWNTNFINRKFLRAQRNHYCLQPLILFTPFN